MKDGLNQLPEFKRKELSKVVEIIRKHATVEMVILFGSHARNSWVSHKYVREDVVYEYNSDFDIFVIVKNKKMQEDFGVWDEIEAECYKEGVRTWISLIVENVHDVNEHLKLGRYFYKEVKEEGICLYDSGNYELIEPKELSDSERKAMALQDFEYWQKNADYFYDDFKSNLEKGRLNNAAFNLHQAAERYVASLLLAHTGYRPKTHDLKSLLEWCEEIDEDIWKIFLPGIDAAEERRLFELLRKSYVDARYEKGFEVTKEELSLLAKSVELLKERVVSLSEDKIK